LEQLVGDRLKIGYARTSTLDQLAGLDAQVRDLETAGCEKLFIEQVSSVAKRPQLEAALDFLREGDTLIVTKLDRLARSTRHLIEISECVARKGANLHICDLSIDTNTAIGKLLLTVTAAISAWEREGMLERQREGIAKARAEGKYKGRKATARAKAHEVIALRAQGLGPSKIARQMGIGRASVYRIIAETAA
jgi:DNA invertase Pin-like site-specific DNA recombinase